MSGKVLYIEDVITPDNLGCRIADYWIKWDMLRQVKKSEWDETQRYIYATDTTKTTNSKLPWSNKTTVPKLCQIRDNLYSNYMATMFPKRKWVAWEGDEKVDETPEKRQAIESYMGWVIDRNEFYDEVSKLVLDYIDYGNCFGTVDWVDRRHMANDDNGQQRLQTGYVGPMIRRISPTDIVFNPISPSFVEAPKIVRSLVSKGEVKEMIERMSKDAEQAEDAETLWDYMKNFREHIANYAGEIRSKDIIYEVAGFQSFQQYLECEYVEILTFYGDMYDEETDTFLRNHVIQVVDRHKVLSKRPSSTYFGSAPIYHVGWRLRPDSLWAMGPLDNLVGMQYRIDHLENIKADLFDLTAFPPLKIRGYVEDFEWGPMERIYVGDDGDLELMSPNVQALQANTEIAILEAKMEEMAGSPKEAMGFRTPGEKTKYEVQRLENAASRIFQNKTAQFERAMTEMLLNAMLESARRHLDSVSIRVFDNELKLAKFREISVQDLTGNGRIKPVAARHFAEQAQLIQDLTNFMASAIGGDPEVRQHFSSIKTARLIERLLELEDYKIVEPNVRVGERLESARLQDAAMEQMQEEVPTPAGIAPDDVEPEGVTI